MAPAHVISSAVTRTADGNRVVPCSCGTGPSSDLTTGAFAIGTHAGARGECFFIGTYRGCYGCPPNSRHRSPLSTDAEWPGFLETLGREAAIALDNVELFNNRARITKNGTVRVTRAVSRAKRYRWLRDCLRWSTYLTSDRPYRKALSRQEALELIRVDKGKHFDPQVVDVFLREMAGEAPPVE